MFHHFRAMRAMKKNIRRSASVIRAHSDPSIPYFRAIRLWTLLEGMNTLSRASGSLQSFLYESVGLLGLQSDQITVLFRAQVDATAPRPLPR